MGFFSSIGKAVGSVFGGSTGGLLSAGANLLGGILSDRSADKRASNQADLQREFAQHGIRWKVEDAKAAGLHPLAAIGAQVTPYQPISVGDSGLGAGIAAAGQDISRAFNATRDRNERATAAALQGAIQQENLAQGRERHRMDMQRAELENALLASQLKRQQVQANPPFPSMSRNGAPNQTGSFVYNPAEITSSQEHQPAREAGTDAPLWKRYQAGPFGTVDLPGQEAAEALESAGPALSIPMTIYRNLIGRHVERLWSGGQKPETPLPAGYRWKWNRWRQTWYATKE